MSERRERVLVVDDDASFATLISELVTEKGYFYAVPSNQPRCLGCMLCAIACPDVAIEVFVHGTQYQFFQYQMGT